MRGKTDVAHRCRESFWLFTAWCFINDLTFLYKSFMSRDLQGESTDEKKLFGNKPPASLWLCYCFGLFSLGWGIFSFHLVSWLAWGKDCVWRSMMICVIMGACGHVVFLMSWRSWEPSRMPYKGNKDRIQSHLWHKLQMKAVGVQTERESEQ